MLTRCLRALALALCFIVSGSALAGAAGGDPDRLLVGVRAAILNLDPSVSGLGSMHGYYRHLYDVLVLPDETLKPRPGLATSWRTINDTTWEFALRPGVKFHDGSAFDAEDVIFTWHRLYTVPQSDHLTAGKMKQVKEMQAVTPLTLRITTTKPYPGLLFALEEMFIVSRHAAATATTDDFNSGKAAIGTGPFKLVRWARGNELVLQRNDAYWGPKPAFATATLREMPNDATRIAALEAGDIDAVDYVPPVDAQRLQRDRRFGVFTATGARTIFLQFDALREQSPFVFDKAGRPLTKNPFKDLRVREALEMAVDEQGIASKIMSGFAKPATQGIPSDQGGFDPTVKRPPFDPAAARKLIAAAGYPDGFALTLHCPSDRYVNDSAICQAAAQTMAQAGLKVEVEALPSSAYFPRLTKGEFSAFLLGWGNDTGDASTLLYDLIHSKDGSGAGSWNFVSVHPALDQKIVAAVDTVDPKRRNALMAECMHQSMAEHDMVPLHNQIVTVAARQGLTYRAMSNEQTLAENFGRAR